MKKLIIFGMAPLTAVLLMLALFTTSCRSPDDYLELPDISTVGEVSPGDPNGITPENRKLLEEIAKEPYPPYRINGGDVFDIKIFDNPDLDVQNLLVTPDGRISMMLLGAVDLSNLTVAEAIDKLEKAYAKYIINPKIAIYPKIINSQTATVFGKVISAGRFPVNEKTRISDVMSLTKGTPNQLYEGDSIEIADYDTSVFIRDGKIIPINFNEALRRGDPLHNILVRANDYIYISTRSDKLVSVIGEVNYPCMLSWNENTGLLQAISKCRGLKDTYWPYAVILRGSIANPVAYRVNIDDVLAGIQPNPKLLSGDTVFIPKDNISEYNVFINKLIPTAQLVNLLLTPVAWWLTF